MANPKKKLIKRKFAQAVLHQMRSVECMAEIAEIFKPQHPEWIPAFDAVKNNIMVSINFIITLATRCFGYFPDELEKWLK